MASTGVVPVTCFSFIVPGRSLWVHGCTGIGTRFHASTLAYHSEV